MRTITVFTALASCYSPHVTGFGLATTTKKISQRDGKLHAMPVPVIAESTIFHEQRIVSEVKSDFYVQSNSKSIVSSSLLTSFGAGNPALESAFGRVASDDRMNIPLRNINAEGNTIDEFYGVKLAQPWSNTDAVTPINSSIDYIKANPELLKEYNIERNMLNLLPIVGVVWGAAYFAMNWINYEVNDQTYMSEEEEAQVLTVQVPLVFGLMGLTYLVALWNS